MSALLTDIDGGRTRSTIGGRASTAGAMVVARGDALHPIVRASDEGRPME